MLLLPPQSSMAPVCLTFKIPAKFLAEIRNGLFIKSISLHSVGGLERNTRSVTKSQEKYTYLIFHPTPLSSNKDLCMSRVIKRTTSVLALISIKLVYTLSGISRAQYILCYSCFMYEARLPQKSTFVQDVCCSLTIQY